MSCRSSSAASSGVRFTLGADSRYDDIRDVGVEPLKKWLRGSGYGGSPEFRGAFAVTLHLLEQAFGKRKDDDPWRKATTEARRAWDLVVRDQRG